MIDPITPFRFIAIRSRADLKRVALGACTLAALELDHCHARSSMEARRLLGARYAHAHVMPEAYALEIIDDYRQIAAAAPDVTGMPRCGGPLEKESLP